MALIATAVVFPLLQGAWESGPLPMEYASSPTAPMHLEDDAVKIQGDLYARTSDPLLKGDVARTLSLASNKEAVKVLERLAKVEKDQMSRQDLLSAMLALEGYAAPSDQAFLRGLLKSGSLTERVIAAVLLMNASGSPDGALELLGSEPAPYAHKFLWPRVAVLAGKAEAGSLETLLTSQIPDARAGAVAAIVAAGGVKANEEALGRLASDQDEEVRFALASALAAGEGGEAILEKLSGDANSSVRAAVAYAKPGDGRERILLALSSDSDAAVRRNACEALSAFPGEATATALSARLGDPDQFVRTAAEKSFAAIKPDREAFAKVESLLDSKVSMASAIRALGLAGDRAAAPKIHDILKKRPDANLTWRSVDALGRLDFKAATKTIAACAAAKESQVRKSVAFSLGLLKERDGFEALRKLAKDSEVGIACEALRSIGLIGGSDFEPVIAEVLSNVQVEPSRRAAACWAVARADVRNPATIKALNTLAVTPCIPVPMSSEKAYDTADVRISALFALSDLERKGNAEAKRTYAEALELFKGPFAKMGGAAGPLLDVLLEDYIRQLETLRAGGSPEPGEVKSAEPELSIKRL